MNTGNVLLVGSRTLNLVCISISGFAKLHSVGFDNRFCASY